MNTEQNNHYYHDIVIKIKCDVCIDCKDFFCQCTIILSLNFETTQYYTCTRETPP